MNIQFLGTCAGSPARFRNVSALALKLPLETWLFDCGEATQHQILRTNIRPSKINKIFITHLHGDHIFGLLGFLSSRSFLGGEALPLTIFAPVGIKNFIETAFKISETYLSYPIEYVEFSGNQTIFQNADYTIKTYLLNHRIDSYAYRIEEKNQAGALNIEALRALGVPNGAILGRLKNGETVQLDDGRILNGQDFLSPEKRGRILTICGDTRPCENAVIASENADLLIHEATFSASESESAQRVFHSTTAESALIAKQAQVKQLILNHISAKFYGEALQTLLTEAQAIFPNTIIAHDFFETEIPRPKE